jgi:hypothetical protein
MNTDKLLQTCDCDGIGRCTQHINEMLTLFPLPKPIKWELFSDPERHGGHYIEERGIRDGQMWYAVTNAWGEVLTVDGWWEHEPMPSSRTGEFFARTRYISVEAATEAYHNYKRMLTK